MLPSQLMVQLSVLYRLIGITRASGPVSLTNLPGTYPPQVPVVIFRVIPRMCPATSYQVPHCCPLLIDRVVQQKSNRTTPAHTARTFVSGRFMPYCKTRPARLAVASPASLHLTNSQSRRMTCTRPERVGTMCIALVLADESVNDRKSMRAPNIEDLGNQTPIHPTIVSHVARSYS